MDQESGFATGDTNLKFYRTTLLLAYQSLGIVYGDICAAPIFVYKSSFSGSLGPFDDDCEILGVLSLVFWTLTIIPLCKYGIFVLGADDNGEGGTFALYSLLCRDSKMGFLKSSNLENASVSSDRSIKETRTSLFIKTVFERYNSSRIVLLLLVLLGTSMLIGDGVLTPTLTVLSAVSGIQVKYRNLTEDCILALTCIILVILFALQHNGTHKVGFIFAPIMIAWLLCLSGVGIYNIFYWNPRVFNALSPYYIYQFFKKTGKDGWNSLGGIILCVTGAEAMFADIGHLSQLAVRIAFVAFVYPCLVLSYMGEAAYLSKNKEDLHNSFYKAIPDGVFWPVFVITTLATMVASQAIISATFSIICQCRALGCFPRVKIVHTSRKIHGQIYIPEVNWVLLALCLGVVLGFNDTIMISNAYGLAVITLMLITTLLMFLIITTFWKQSVLMALLFVLSFGSVELAYFSACLAKVHIGGWFSLTVSLFLSSLMSSWHYGTLQKQAYEAENKVSIDNLLNLGPNLGMTRVAGICIVYTNLTCDIPQMFVHFITNFPVLHQVLIFANLQAVMVPKVPDSERFLFQRIEPPELFMFRCTVRYGYKDSSDSYGFETQLVEKMTEFLKWQCNSNEIEVADQSLLGVRGAMLVGNKGNGNNEELGGEAMRRKVRFQLSDGQSEEVSSFMEAQEAGIAYIIGNTSVMAGDTSSLFKRFVINIIYGSLRSVSRRPATTLAIPQSSLVEVCMVYRV